MTRAAFALLSLLFVGSAVPAAQSPPVTRGEFVSALWAQWGAVPYEDTRIFYDVPHNAPETTAVCWAADLGLTKGVGPGRFAPGRPITREEAAVILRRAAEYLGRDTATQTSLAECNDMDGISFWADDSLYWCTDIGLIDWAVGGLMAPQGTITAQELTEILFRFG